MIQDYNRSEHRVQEICCPMCFIMSVIISFNVYFFLGGGEEKNESLNFAESNAHQKKKRILCVAALKLSFLA